MIDGTIMKGIGGFYYVKCASEDTVYSCRARGKFRKDGLVPVVGDKVKIDVTDTEKLEGYVTEIYPRRNVFFRPPVSNIDLLLVTFAAKDPEPALDFIDKLTVTAIAQNVSCAICINKTDLDRETAERLAEIRGTDAQTLIDRARENGCRIYGINTEEVK